MESLVRLVVGRAMCIERCIANQSPESSGGMLVIREPLEKSQKRLDHFPELTLANRNAPKQGVVAGPIKQLEALQNLLEKDGVDAVRLDLSVAYHHKCLQPAADEFGEILQQVVIQAPAGGRSVRLSTDPSRALMDPADIRAGLRSHLCGQVDFQASVAQTEAMWPGAVYVDVGPRQTGSRLLHANSVDPERTLRMDDRDDPASQPIQVAFKLLSHGFSVDESSLMRLASQPLSSSWVKDRRGRLPYLVNGHAAVPLDGSPMPPSPLVPVPIPHNEVQSSDVMAQSGPDRLLDVYSEYQKTMRKFLESQDQVFSALTGGASEVRPTLSQSSAPIKDTEVLNPVPIRSDVSIKSAPPVAVVEPSPSQPSSSESPPAAAPVKVPAAVASAATANTSGVFSTQQTMQDFIIEVLVDRTGYPPELLELDAHFESDLGIDSIKQVEVLGALIDAMPTAPDPAQMQEIRTQAREKQNINELASFMLALHEGKA